MTKTIDLNADVGEGAGNDAELIPLVTSANIACGAHAGDEATIEAAVLAAVESGVAIGAHPGHADREQFGRVPLPISTDDVGKLVVPQIERVSDAAERVGARVRYVKLHGALYHQIASDRDLAVGFLKAIDTAFGPLPALGLGGSELNLAAAAISHPFAAEGFADRRYLPDGSLMPRSNPDATLDHASDVAKQAVGLATDGVAIAVGGARVAVPCQSLCLHGDGPHAVASARAARSALAGAGIRLRAFAD